MQPVLVCRPQLMLMLTCSADGKLAGAAVLGSGFDFAAELEYQPGAYEWICIRVYALRFHRIIFASTESDSDVLHAQWNSCHAS